MRTLGLAPRTLLAWIFALLWTPLCSLLFLIPALFRPAPHWMNTVHRIFSSGILWAAGIQVEIRGVENLRPARSAILMANHRSLLDIPVLADNLDHLRFVAKKSLGFIPIFGWAIALSEHVLINRRNRNEAVRTLHRMATFFSSQKKGRNIVVFPEGTRSRTAELLPFKKGGFHLAYDLGFPIQPISIQGMEHIFPKGAWLLKPGKVRLVIHPQVPVAGLDRSQVLEMRRVIQDTLKRGLSTEGAEGGR